jgi:23S rRNA (cytidine2498-2'-O)-methyltransferase
MEKWGSCASAAHVFVDQSAWKKLLPLETMRLHTCEPGWEDVLLGELARVFPRSRHSRRAAGWIVSELVDDECRMSPSLAFAAQTLPRAEMVAPGSISAWAETIGPWLIERMQQHEGPWRLHLYPGPSDESGETSASAASNAPSAGRCRLIHEALLQWLKKKQRRLLRQRVIGEGLGWSDGESLAQVALTSATEGWLSYCEADERERLRRCQSRFPGGQVSIPPDRQAPSRAFQKLAEAEIRLGRAIAAGETCVDLGSSPGSWAYLALKRDARVIAIDRSPLRSDLMTHRNLTFVQGDAFRYEPPAQVDWLLCDVIAFPERVFELLQAWLTQGRCRFFCVTIKFRGAEDYPQLETMKAWLATSGAEFFLRRLSHNKNEVTAFGKSPTTAERILGGL